VAGKGRLGAASDLAGWELVSLAGHSSRFIRGPALATWGELPASLSITFSGAVLSALRKAAQGEDVALLLDAHQAESLGRLPFADALEIVHTSGALPVSLLCAVGDRMAQERLAAVVGALQSLHQLPEAAEALAGVRVERFVDVDRPALERAITSFEER
jgi:hypothetical protein